MPVETAGALANSEWIHGIRHERLRVGRGEHLQAAGRVRGDHPPAGGAHRGVERVACAERLAAALAGTVPARDRVRALLAGLHRALLGVEQPVADREAAGLVEADRGCASCSWAPHTGPAATVPRSRRMFSACGPEAREAPIRSSSRFTTSQSMSRNVNASRRSAAASAEQAVQRGLGDRPSAEARDHRVAVQLDAGERHAHVRRDDPADADGERLLEHDHALGVAERRRASRPAETGGTS